MALGSTAVWTRLSDLLHRVSSSAMLDLVGMPEPRVAGRLDVREGLPRYKVTIYAGLGTTLHQMAAVLAHECGHITQYEEELPIKTEVDASRRGMAFAKEWGVQEEYLGLQETFHEGAMLPHEEVKSRVESFFGGLRLRLPTPPFSPFRARKQP